MGESSGCADHISVCAMGAAVWTEDPSPEFRAVHDLADPNALQSLRQAHTDKRTVWLEAKLDGLSENQTTWLEGEYPIWDAMNAPRFNWEPMTSILRAVGLEAPTPSRETGETGARRLLRALPYAYTRGAFGVARDALDDPDLLPPLVSRTDRRVTVFPTAGFRPGELRPRDRRTAWYTVIHATVAVFGEVILFLRLPNSACPTNIRRPPLDPGDLLAPVEVLNRFLPMDRMPTGREVAEAFGMHQATSARAVASAIRSDLRTADDVATELTDDGEIDKGHQRKKPRAHLREKAAAAAAEVNGFAEISQLLNRNLATILRRFGGKMPRMDPVASELVPREVKRRYLFALDNVRSLQESCQLSSQSLRQALANYERSQRDHFQFIAALLASIVLIPTLLASLFGVNLGVPGEHDNRGFWVFVFVIVAWSIEAYFALKKARDQDWNLSSRQRFTYIALAAVTAIGSVLFAVAML